MRRREVLGALAALPLAREGWASDRAASGRPTDGSVERELMRWSGAAGFAGVVALGRHGVLRYAKAIGAKAIGPAPIAVTTDTRFPIGSVSKWLTTVAVLRLVDRKLLALDAPIATYFEGVPGDAGSRVLLRHLLSNTSGIPDRLQVAAKADPAWRTATVSAREVVRRFVPGDLAFAPGARFDYTVLNWVIVRALLEQCTGQPFGTAIESLVLNPARLNRTGIAEQGFAAVPGLASGYDAIQSGVAPAMRVTAPVPAFAAASGSFYADARDLVRAAHLFFGPTLLSAAARTAMLNVQVPEEGYALGGRVRLIAGRRWAWETGKIGAYRTHLAHDVGADRTVVVLGNADTAQAAIAELVERLAAFA